MSMCASTFGSLNTCQICFPNVAPKQSSALLSMMVLREDFQGTLTGVHTMATISTTPPSHTHTKLKPQQTL